MTPSSQVSSEPLFHQLSPPPVLTLPTFSSLYVCRHVQVMSSGKQSKTPNKPLKVLRLALLSPLSFTLFVMLFFLGLPVRSLSLYILTTANGSPLQSDFCSHYSREVLSAKSLGLSGLLFPTHHFPLSLLRDAWASGP